MCFSSVVYNKRINLAKHTQAGVQPKVTTIDSLARTLNVYRESK